MKKLDLKKGKTKPSGRPPLAEGSKVKVFSVSFKELDLSEIATALSEMKSMFGAKVSRNELVRRATIAHVRFMRLKNKGKAADYAMILEGVQ